MHTNRLLAMVLSAVAFTLAPMTSAWAECDPAECEDPGEPCKRTACTGSGVSARCATTVLTGTSCDLTSAPGTCYQTKGQCSAAGTCVKVASASGTACTLSTSPGTCYQTTGQCNGSGTCNKVPSPSGTTCALGTTPGICYQASGQCNGSGTCQQVPKASGTTCDDGNPCTLTSACNGAGSCVGTSNKACPPASDNGCYLAGTCDPSTGNCTPVFNNGNTCTDGNTCTKGDTCQNGNCIGTAYSCTKPLGKDTLCWLDTTCDGNGGCVNTFYGTDQRCNADDNECTDRDHCDGAGTCLVGAPKACSTPPNNQCWADTGVCIAPAGDCQYTVKSGSCDDGNACTYADTCDSSGVCKGTVGKSCAATAECPIASTCDGKGGCIAPPDIDTVGNCSGKQGGADCTTCNPCLINQKCNADGQCVGTKAADGTACSAESCLAGMCLNGQCSCMTPAPQPDLAPPVNVTDLGTSPSGGEDASAATGGGEEGGGESGDDGEGGGNGNGGSGSDSKGGCTMTPHGDSPVAAWMILMVVGVLLWRRGRLFA